MVGGAGMVYEERRQANQDPNAFGNPAAVAKSTDVSLRCLPSAIYASVKCQVLKFEFGLANIRSHRYALTLTDTLYTHTHTHRHRYNQRQLGAKGKHGQLHKPKAKH